MEVKALQQMLSQFRQVQERLEKQIGEIIVEASAGGGMVSVKMNGQKQLTEVRIEPDVFKGKDQEMLQELVLGAVNEATRRVDEELSKQVKDITGGLPGMAGMTGMKFPGMF
ncbi:MAG: YbaB/EbfC family nucleoid-associated protein [Candidatus Acidiferrales bacterium]